MTTIHREYGIQLGISKDGTLYLSQDGKKWELYDFNQNYKNYYSPCIFSAVGYAEGSFYAAGMDHQGNTVLYTSLLGSVWNPIILQDLKQAVFRLKDEIVQILNDSADHMIYLVSRNGFLVTVPPCVKCMKICRITEETLLHAYLDSHSITLETANGQLLIVPKVACAEYEVTSIFAHHARKQKRAKWVYVDSMEQVRRELGESEADDYIIFHCESGFSAMDAALFARSRGFTNAFYMKGAKQ